MNIFYTPIVAKYSMDNYNNSVLQCATYNNLQIKNVLHDDAFADTNVGLWGFHDGGHNLTEFNKIANGDVIFFRGKDDEGFAAFLGFGYIAKKLVSADISSQVWDNCEYKNIIVIDKYIQFYTPFRLLEKQSNVASLNHVPSGVWHDGYNMFRRWVMDYNEEEFIRHITDQNVILNSYLNPNIDREQLSCDIETSIPSPTEKEQLVKIRLGHGVFKRKLLEKSRCCKICGLDDERFLIASHIKAWKHSDNRERLDDSNGFLLCPAHDLLFDRGFICFDQDGNIIISESLDAQACNHFNIHRNMKLSLDNKQLKYVAWHRENTFRGN